MGMKSASPTPSIGFVNGSYADGKAIVTNGNTITFDSPTQYRRIEFPLTSSINVVSTVGVMPSDGIGTARFYALIDDADVQIGGNTHPAEEWSEASASGTMTALVITPRSATYSGSITFSLKVDGEVIF